MASSAHKSIIKRKTPQAADSSIGVYLRLRPLEKAQPTVVKLNNQEVKTFPPDPAVRPQFYRFTKVFDDASQGEIFDEVGRPVVQKYLQGKDGLVFSYGITGSGKTYTMEGVRGNSGLIFRTLKYIFNSIGNQQTKRGQVASDGHNSYRLVDQEQLYPALDSPVDSTVDGVDKFEVPKDTQYSVFVSLIELYNKKLIDLFEDLGSRSDQQKKREIRYDRQRISYVANATEIEVKTAEEAEKYYRLGVCRRRTGTTALNQESSRGHCVLTLKLIRCQRSWNGSSLTANQLCLVDLAGSERAKRSGATGETLHEACSINNSLGALRKCIRALRDGQANASLQYREHNLTRLFRTYFEGRGIVSMILCVKPTKDDFGENMTALEFGLIAQDVPTDQASPPKRTRGTNDIDLDITDLEPNMKRTLDLLERNQDMDLGEKLRILAETNRKHSGVRQRFADKVSWRIKEFRTTLVSMSEDWQALKRREQKIVKELEVREKEIDLRNQLEELKDLDVCSQSDRMEGCDYSETTSTSTTFRPRTRTSPSAPAEAVEETYNLRPSRTRTRAPPTAPIEEPVTTRIDVRSENRADYVTSPTLNTSADTFALAADPKHLRSHSCSCMHWIDHKPAGTISTSTSIKPRIKNRRSVKVLRTSDILRKDAAGYSIIHQNAEPNGDVTSSLFTGKIVSTVTGGAQVILDDVEVLKRESPIKRRRAASDAAC